MLVYRVAHRTALTDGFPSGPYVMTGDMPAADRSLVDAMRWDHSDDAHPSPYWDPKLFGIRDEERCGFDSMVALHRWFAGWLDKLHTANFMIYVYETSAPRVGENGQALFNPNKSRLVRTEPLIANPVQLELFDMEECPA